MKKFKKIVCTALCFAMAVPFAACNEKQEEEPSKTPVTTFWHEGDKEENEAFRAFTMGIFKSVYQNDMLNLHFTVMEPENYGITRPEMDLFSEGGFDDESILTEMKKFDYNKLSRENQITYRIMEEDLTDALDWSKLAPLSSAFSYSSGIQTNLTSMATEYEFFIEQDVKDYLKMMDQIPEYFDYCLEDETERVEMGYGYADFVLNDIIQQCNDVASEGADSCFISSFDERIDAFKGISDAKKTEYKAQNKAIVLEQVFPAYEKLAKEIATFKGKGKNEGGLCGFGDEGKAYYEMLVKSKSGYGGTVKELYDELWNYYDKIYSDFTKLLSNKTANTQYNAWSKGKVVTPTDPIEILDFFSANLSEIFPPIVGTTYSVKYLSESIAKTMPDTLAYYMVPQIDNYKNGSITINPYSGDAAGAMNTVCHEGYPGHFYQNVYFMSKNPDPVRTLFSFLGYTEGWAVYAANRAAYVYTYPTDATYFYRFDELNTSLSYAMYAIMDIGVNYMGWTAKELGSRMGFESDVAEELYNTFIEMPGVYLSYGAGNYQMYKLRSQITSKILNFNDVEFHQFLLDVGPCNFDLLSSLLDEFYEFKKLGAMNE